MSSGADCWFAEKEPNKWFYAVQQYPYGEVEDYNQHGPFKSFTVAREHLDTNYQNPGGWSLEVHQDHEHSGLKEIDTFFDPPVSTWLCCGEEVESG